MGLSFTTYPSSIVRNYIIGEEEGTGDWKNRSSSGCAPVCLGRGVRPFESLFSAFDLQRRCWYYLSFYFLFPSRFFLSLFPFFCVNGFLKSSPVFYGDQYLIGILVGQWSNDHRFGCLTGWERWKGVLTGTFFFFVSLLPWPFSPRSLYLVVWFELSLHPSFVTNFFFLLYASSDFFSFSFLSFLSLMFTGKKFRTIFYLKEMRIWSTACYKASPFSIFSFCMKCFFFPSFFI